jgi:oxygen-dependent protoporphyrinogen oxidase
LSASSDPNLPVVIIGGGVTGLAAAYQLVRAGRALVLVEAQPRLGGVVQTTTVEGCVLEAGPDSFLSAKPAALDLIGELGLQGEVIGSNDHSRVTYLVKRGRLVPLPDGLMMMVPTKVLPVALSPLLGLGTKARMGLDFFRRPPGEPQPDRTVAEFVASHYGREAVDYLAEPLLAGVYGGSADSLSVGSVLPRFVELESRYGSLTRGVLAAKRKAPKDRKAPPLFQTLRTGLGRLTAELEQRILPATRVIHGAAEQVARVNDAWKVRVNGEWVEAGGVIMATPAWMAGLLLRSVDHKLAALLEGVEYSSSVTMALGYRREHCGPIPPGFGFLVPAKERRTLVACTFVGAKFPNRVPDSHVVLRCFLGGAGEEAVLDLPDDAILQAVLAQLQRLLGWSREPDFQVIHRWRRAMAQYSVGHATRIQAVRSLVESMPGLQVAGNAYDGIGVPDCVRTGRAAADALLRR